MAGRATQRHRSIAIYSPLGPEVLLFKSMAGHERMSRLFSYKVDMLSEDVAISFNDIIGTNVTIRLETTRGGTRYFNGLVKSFAQRRRDGSYASYEAEIVPSFWLLTRTSNCRIFQNMTVVEIIEQILGDHGLTDYEVSGIRGNHPKWEYCVQYRETQFNFISRLCEQEGIFYYFKHDDGKHTLAFADNPGGYATALSGYSDVSYRPPEQASTDPEHIRFWRYAKHVEPGKYTLRDFNFENPPLNLEASETTVCGGYTGSDFEMYDYPGEYTQIGLGRGLAKLRMEECETQHEICEGSGDVRGMATGRKFTFKDHPRSDQDREYAILSAAIQLESDEYLSGQGTLGGRLCQCSFTAIPASVAFRAERITPKPIIQGCQTAIVVGPAGEEIFPDKYGRVKVQFHWDREGKSDEDSSCWIRVSQGWAGKQWGQMYIPRIGHEVIVEFLEGDPDRPIITGRIYNGDNMPPYTLPGEKTKSTLKSNSSKGGGGFNEIRLEDKKGSEQIFLHAEKDQDIRVKADRRESIGNDRHLTVGRHKKEHIKTDKHITVDGNHSEKVKGTVSIDVGMKKDVKVGMGYAVKASMIDLKADMINIDASLINIKSSTIMTIDGGGILFLKAGGVLINSGGNAMSARAAAPDAPEAPDGADTATAGGVAKAPKKAKPPKPAKYSSSAKAVKRAAASGAPAVCTTPSPS